MILAAGRGERLRPLTDHCPKPLLQVGGKPLIVWHLERLAGAGYREVVINHAHLGQMLVDRLGDGRAFGLTIHWSAEPPGALETAGGIAKALALLGEEIFLVVNGDIFCPWDPAAAAGIGAAMKARGDLAHLVMVANPPQHPAGDFLLEAGRVQTSTAAQRLTFSGIGLYQPALFSGLAPNQAAKLAPLLVQAINAGRVSGECYTGPWHDIGTAQRLEALDSELRRGL